MIAAFLLVFLDSNIVFSASRSAASPFLRLWNIPGLQLLTSPHSLYEIRKHYESSDQERRSEALLASMARVSDRPDIVLPSGIVLPPKDEPIYQAALGAGADYLVTGDRKHFSPYYNRTIMGLTVIEPMPFLRKLGEMSH